MPGAHPCLLLAPVNLTECHFRNPILPASPSCRPETSNYSLVVGSPGLQVYTGIRLLGALRFTPQLRHLSVLTALTLLGLLQPGWAPLDQPAPVAAFHPVHVCTVEEALASGGRSIANFCTHSHWPLALFDLPASLGECRVNTQTGTVQTLRSPAHGNRVSRVR